MSETPRILVVDDEPTVRTAIELMLEEREWLVVAAANGWDAVRAAAETPFDVVVLDKNLPDITGVEVLRHIRQHDTEIRAIMLTGYANVESAVEMAVLGVDAFVEKPLNDIYALGDIISSSLHNKKRAAQCQGAREQEVLVGDEALGFLVNTVLVVTGGVDVHALERWLRALDLNPSVFHSLKAADEALRVADLVVLACADGILSTTKELRAAHPDCRLVVFQPDPTLVTTMALIGHKLTGIVTEDLAGPEAHARLKQIVSRVVKEL